MNSRFAALAVVVVVLAGCQTAVTAPDSMTLLDEARQAAAAMQQSLASKLFAEINTNGAESAIGVCKTLAPGAAAELSAQRGMRVSRVSLKPRNPVLGAADAWEQRVLIDFDRRAAQGENSGALEHSEVVAEPAARYFRYMKALPVQPLCVACHGPAESLARGMRARIEKEYPSDRATGYQPGQIRGAITIKRALP